MYKKVGENKYGQVKYVIDIDSGKSLAEEIKLLPKTGITTGCIAECIENSIISYYYYTKGEWVKLKSDTTNNVSITPIPNSFIDSLTF